MKLRSFAVTMVSFLIIAAVPVAVAQTEQGLDKQNSLETIEELTRRGKHFEALTRYVAEGQLETVAEKLAAARSAWALGLVDVARELWDEAFANREFKDIERSRAMLARSILELQETRYESARSFAESAASNLSASDLRAQLWLVIAEGLKEQGALSLAEGYYKKAFEEGHGNVSSEAAYLLGECQYKLGLVNDARYTFAEIETRSQYTSQALRRLAEIDLTQRNYEGVLTWIDEGRESYPTEFNDGWSTYARVEALVNIGRTGDAVRELDNFLAKNSERDTWFLLAQAAVESQRAREVHAVLAENGKDKPNTVRR